MLATDFHISLSAASSSTMEVRSSTVYVFGPLGQGWRVRQPLAVTVEMTDHGYVVADELFNVYGAGDSWDEAVEDYKSSLVEYGDIVFAHADAPTRALARRLGAYVEPPRQSRG